MELYPFSIQPIKGNNCGLIPIYNIYRNRVPVIVMTSECHALFQFPGKSIFRFSEKWKWFIKIDDVMYYVYKILIMSQKQV